MGNHTQPCPIKHLSPAHLSSTTGILMTGPLYYNPSPFPHKTTYRLNIFSVPAEYVALIRSQAQTVAGNFFCTKMTPQTRNTELVWGIYVSGHNIFQHKSCRGIMSHQVARRTSLCHALLNSKLTDSLPAVTVQCISVMCSPLLAVLFSLLGMREHPPISVCELADHIERLKANDALRFSQEYEVGK